MSTISIILLVILFVLVAFITALLMFYAPIFFMFVITGIILGVIGFFLFR